LKWKTGRIEAAKQVGKNWLPHVHTPRKLKESLISRGSASPAQPAASQRHGCSTEKMDSRYDLQLIGSLQPDATI